MTIINPNSIAGITSVTAEAGVMNFYKSDGTLAGLQLNGVNFNTTSGISTFNNVYVGGTITYEDVKNVDSVGIITARAGIVAQDDVTFTGATSGRDVFWDKSANTLLIKDNASLNIGTGNDLQIYHNSGNNHSYISEAGGGSLVVLADDLYIQDTSTNSMIQCIEGAQVQLHYAGNKKLETTSSGIDVTGTAVADALNVTGTSVVATVKSTNNNYVMQMQGNNATDKVYFGTTSGNDFIIANTSSVTERLRITSAGAVVAGGTAAQASDAVTLMPDGEVTAAGFYFSNNIGSPMNSDGFRRHTTGTICIDAASGERVRITSTSTIFKNTGYVSFNDNGYIRTDSSGYLRLQMGSNGTMFTNSSNSELARIAPTGQVLIGETATSGMSAYDLGMKNNTAIRFRKADGSAWINTVGLDNSNNLKLGWGGSVDEIHFGIAGIGEQARFDSSGRLLIGTTTLGSTSADDLTVATSGVTGITIRSGTSNSGNIFFADGTSGNDTFRGYVQYLHSSNALLFGTNAGERLRITSTGIVGVGVDDPAVAGGYNGMEIGGSNNTGLRLSCTASSGWAFTDYEANGTQKFMAGMKGSTDANVCSWRIVTGASLDSNVKFAVTENGKFGFGTASPSYPIHLAGEGIAIDRNAGDPYIALRTSDDTKVSIYGGASTGFRVFTKPSGGSSAERLRIDPNGKVGINEDTPYAELDVRGVTLLSDDIGSTIPSRLPELDVQLMIYTSTNGQPIANNDCARVLIATDAKQTGAQGYHGALDFGSSDVSASGNSAEWNWRTASIMCRGDGDTSSTAADGDLQFWTKMGNGNLTHRFDIAPNGSLTGTDTSIGNLSDQRLKKNIQDYTYDLNKFKQLKTRTFDWINPEFHQEGNIRGFIAQEVDAVDNYWNYQFEVAKESAKKDYDLLEDGSEDYNIQEHRPARASKLNGKDTMYVSVIQQLISKIETLEAEVAALKSS